MDIKESIPYISECDEHSNRLVVSTATILLEDEPVVVRQKKNRTRYKIQGIGQFQRH